MSPVPADDAKIAEKTEAAINSMKTLRLTQVIFSHDPDAEASIRTRLESLAGRTSDPEWAAQYPGEITAFLHSYLDRAMKTAPDEAMAAAIHRDADNLKALQRRPADCVAYFHAQGGMDLAKLPTDLRVELAEGYADLVEAALERPVPEPVSVDQGELGRLIDEGYQQAGFPFDDLSRLNAPGLDDAESCRLANEYMMAVTALTDAELATLYRGLTVMINREP